MRLLLDLDDGTNGSRPLEIEAEDGATIGAIAVDVASRLRAFDLQQPSFEIVGRPAQPLLIDTPVAVADLRSGDRVRLVNGQPGARTAKIGSATMVIESGPDSGRRIELGPGLHVVGRGGSSTITLNDPLISRTHLSLDVSDVVVVADYGSTNGVMVERDVIGRPVVLKAGQRITAGDTVFRVEQHSGSMSAAPRGTVAFNRPPRVFRPYQGSLVELPTPPGPPPRQRIPKLAAVFPLIMGAVMYKLTKSITSLVFMGMSPILMIGNQWENRYGSKKDHGDALRDFEERRQLALRKIADQHALERESREIESPSIGEMVAFIDNVTNRLWERSSGDNDFLDLRLGTGALPSRTEIKLPSGNGGLANLLEKLSADAESLATIADLPIVAKLSEIASLGLAGPQVEVDSIARSLVLQAAALHSPADLIVTALLGEPAQARWDWLMWLPHTSSITTPLTANHLPPTADEQLVLLDGLAQLAEKRRSGPSGSSMLPAVLVVIDESVRLDRARINWLFDLPPSLRIVVVWLGSSLSRMPKGCDLVADTPGGGAVGTVGNTVTGERFDRVAFEGVTVAQAVRLARRLTPMVDVTAGGSGGGSLPPSVALVDILGDRSMLRNSEVIVERWNSSTSLKAFVGQSGSGPFSLDIRVDGPHALVAGTTNAGKSELLQTLIASLAASHSPKRVTFLLVDYKGGAAFSECVKFPHTVGLVTDLDVHQVRRALTSLNAELTYREHVLQAAKAKDIIEMEKMQRPDTPPNLLLVVDEFAALAKEVPEFVEGVVNVAQRGRSLGIHLVLGTQSPGGVVTGTILANTNLRIALRTTDANESSNVLGSPAAATISRSTPGRAVARVGPQELIPFQSGYVGGHSSLEKTEPTIRIADVGYGTRQPWDTRFAGSSTSKRNDEPNDLKRLVATANEAARHLRLAPPRKPWLAPLSDAFDLFTLPRSEGDTKIYFGLADEPERQAQHSLAFEPERDGSLAVFGASGSGKSSVLWAIAASASAALVDPPVVIYALDFAGRSMETLSELPNVGAVIMADEHERVTRLLTTLRATVSERLALFAPKKAGSLSDYRRVAPTAAPVPRIIVLLDGYQHFYSAYERIERGVWAELMARLIAEGRQVGVHFVVTADRRGSLPNAVFSSIQQRVVLRLANSDDYGSLGVPSGVLTADSPPGRCVVGKLEAQVAVAGGATRSDEQAAAMTKLGRQLQRQRPGHRAPNINVLATEVFRRDLAGRAAIGQSGATLGPVEFSLDEGVFLVAGPMRSGKTNALASISLALAERSADRPRILFCGRRSPLLDLDIWAQTAQGADDGTVLAKQLLEEMSELSHEPLGPDFLAPILVVDNLHEFHEGDFGKALSALLKAARDIPMSLVAAADSLAARRAASYTVLGETKLFKQGLLLAPDVAAGDGDILGAVLPSTSQRVWPEGRGYIVRRGTVELVQIAIP